MSSRRATPIARPATEPAGAAGPTGAAAPPPEPRTRRPSYAIIDAAGPGYANGNGSPSNAPPLPAAEPPPPPPTLRRDSRRPNDGAGEPIAAPACRILIIAAERALRDGLCGALLAAGLYPAPVEPAGVTPEAIEVSTVGCAVIGLVGPDDAEAFRAIRALFAAGPKVGIIAVGKAGSTDLILSAMRAGARDYLPRPVRPEALVETVRRQLERSAADRAAAHAGLPPAFDLLSQRECEVLDLVVRGHSTKQIAAQIGRVEKTVEYHRKRIMDKLGVNTAVQLVRLVTLHGWRGEAIQRGELAR